METLGSFLRHMCRSCHDSLYVESVLFLVRSTFLCYRIAHRSVSLCVRDQVHVTIKSPNFSKSTRHVTFAFD